MHNPAQLGRINGEGEPGGDEITGMEIGIVKTEMGLARKVPQVVGRGGGGEVAESEVKSRLRESAGSDC